MPASAAARETNAKDVRPHGYADRLSSSLLIIFFMCVSVFSMFVHFFFSLSLCLSLYLFLCHMPNGQGFQAGPNGWLGCILCMTDRWQLLTSLLW